VKRGARSLTIVLFRGFGGQACSWFLSIDRIVKSALPFPANKLNSPVCSLSALRSRQRFRCWPDFLNRLRSAAFCFLVFWSDHRGLVRPGSSSSDFCLPGLYGLDFGFAEGERGGSPAHAWRTSKANNAYKSKKGYRARMPPAVCNSNSFVSLD